MKRRCCLTWGILLAGLALNAGAQQSAPAAAPAPPPLVGTLAAHPDWPAAKNPSDVDTVDHLVASLYNVISGPAGSATGTVSARYSYPMGALAWLSRNPPPQKMRPRAKAIPFPDSRHVLPTRRLLL